MTIVKLGSEFSDFLKRACTVLCDELFWAMKKYMIRQIVRALTFIKGLESFGWIILVFQPLSFSLGLNTNFIGGSLESP